MKKKSIKSKIKILLSTVFLLSICMCFTLFLDENKSLFLSLAEEKTVFNEEKVVESVEEFNASNLPLISAIPERNIYLYAIKPTGVVLYVDGKGHYFDWTYITPRFILPKMHVGDFDNDEKEELAVILYVGSGTGVGVEELHIVEISEEEVLSTDLAHKDYSAPNPEYFADHCYHAEEYLSQLNELVKLKTYDKEEELSADITVGDELYTVSLKQLQSEYPDITINDTVCFGNFVHFHIKDGKLTAEFALGVTTNSYPIPRFIGDVHADVNYNKGNFTLSNLQFEVHEEF